MEEIKKDDGSLGFLDIPREKDGYFNCPTTNQQKIVNTSFWIVDIQEHVNTKQNSKHLLKTILKKGVYGKL